MARTGSTAGSETPDSPSLHGRLSDVFWSRHANPWSSGTRILSTPVLVYAIYRRNRRLLVATLAFVVVNPVLFPRPARTDRWLSRIVLAERAWIDEGNGTLGLGYPNVLNLLNVPASVLAVYAAIRRRPVATVLATGVAMALKLWWVDAIVRQTGVTGEGPAE